MKKKTNGYNQNKKQKEIAKSIKFCFKSLKAKTEVVTKIKNKYGDILPKDEDIMNSWKKYFQELLVTIENINVQGNFIKARKIIQQLKNGKAPGDDELTAEMFEQAKME